MAYLRKNEEVSRYFAQFFFDEKRSHPLSNREAGFGIADEAAGFEIADDVAGFGIADDVAGFGIANDFEDIAQDDERILTNN